MDTATDKCTVFGLCTMLASGRCSVGAPDQELVEVFYCVPAAVALPVSRAENEENVRIEILEPAYPVENETNLPRVP